MFRVSEEGGETTETSETSETPEEDLPPEAPPILKYLKTPTDTFTPAKIPGKNLFVCLSEHHLRLMTKFWWKEKEQVKIVFETEKSGYYANVDVNRWDVGTQKLFTGVIVAAEELVGIWFNTGTPRERKARIWDFHKSCVWLYSCKKTKKELDLIKVLPDTITTEHKLDLKELNEITKLKKGEALEQCFAEGIYFFEK